MEPAQKPTERTHAAPTENTLRKTIPRTPATLKRAKVFCTCIHAQTQKKKTNNLEVRRVGADEEEDEDGEELVRRHGAARLVELGCRVDVARSLEHRL
eukprot:1659860-Rhodomonas_salina.1